MLQRKLSLYYVRNYNYKHCAVSLHTFCVFVVCKETIQELVVTSLIESTTRDHTPHSLNIHQINRTVYQSNSTNQLNITCVVNIHQTPYRWYLLTYNPPQPTQQKQEPRSNTNTIQYNQHNTFNADTSELLIEGNLG